MTPDLFEDPLGCVLHWMGGKFLGICNLEHQNSLAISRSLALLSRSYDRSAATLPAGAFAPDITVVETPIRRAIATDAEGDRIFQIDGIIAPMKIKTEFV